MPAKCCVETLNKMLKPEHADEPVFLLRAQDKLAPHVVNIWIVAAREAHVDEEKIKKAIWHRNSMERWQHDNQSRVKVPD